jgi:hypothetical protein
MAGFLEHVLSPLLDACWRRMEFAGDAMVSTAPLIAHGKRTGQSSQQV